MSIYKWKCDDCGHVSTTSELLTAPNPFDPEDIIIGCPNCKSINSTAGVCEIAGCNDLVSCGGPGADGVYRSTCGKHADWLRKG